MRWPLLSMFTSRTTDAISAFIVVGGFVLGFTGCVYKFSWPKSSAWIDARTAECNSKGGRPQEYVSRLDGRTTYVECER